MAITPLPTAPSRAVPSTFSTLADAFLAALSTFVTEANLLETNVNAKEVTASAAAVTAAAEAVSAAASSANAIATTNAAKWVSGTTYAIGDCVWSPKDYTVYRRKTNGAGTTDPASDGTNWIGVNLYAAADAVLAREPDQGVAMTYAASGSRGITVADNDNIDFGTDNFTLVWKGSLPNWTPSVIVRFLYKIQDADNRFGLSSSEVGPYFFARVGGVTLFESTVFAKTLIDGTSHELVAVVTRETVSTAGSVVVYVDGVQLGSSYPITAAATVSISNTGVLNILGDSIITGLRNASTTHHVYTFNRALTAAEVLDLYRNGIAPKHRKASQTALTSGTLVTGQEYTIDTFAAGDDFANVGGTNETGNVFVATGTTPTTWTNSSSLRATGGTLILEPEGIQPAGANSQWLDSSSNKLNATLPAAGATNTRKIDSGRYVWPTAMTDDTTWTSILPAGFVLEKVIFNNSTANACELRLGTSAGGTQMAATITIAASTFTTATIDKVVSLTANTTLYLSDTGAGWNSASLTATLFFRRFN